MQSPFAHYQVRPLNRDAERRQERTTPSAAFLLHCAGSAEVGLQATVAQRWQRPRTPTLWRFGSSARLPRRRAHLAHLLLVRFHDVLWRYVRRWFTPARSRSSRTAKRKEDYKTHHAEKFYKRAYHMTASSLSLRRRGLLHGNYILRYPVLAHKDNQNNSIMSGHITDAACGRRH